MAYETKVLLMAITEIVGSNDNIEDIWQAIARIANVEGVVLESLEEFKKKKKGSMNTPKQ